MHSGKFADILKDGYTCAQLHFFDHPSSSPSQPLYRSMDSTNKTNTDREAIWIEGLFSGNLNVFGDIFREFAPNLTQFAQISVPNQVAEELVQEVFFSLWTRRSEIQVKPGELASYLFGSTRKQVLRYLRGERVRDRYSELVATENEARSEIASPEAELLAQEFEDHIRLALKKLSPIQHEVMLLRWTQEMSYNDIAKLLGITPESAMQNVSRVRRLLQPVLSKFFPEFK